MSQKTKTIIKETEEVSERDNPAVLAYRVGQLEIGQGKGFAEVKQQNNDLLNKMDALANNFASKSDLEALEKQATTEHKNLWKEIEAVRTEVRGVKRWLNWGTKTVLGAVLIAILSLVMLTNVVHH